ncbi:MAG TPA: hypothetical protein VH370_06035 [Humisphaera sp.]|jgi:hypothetical protein|nr:hypothetical protein [Humisphaera sp.]
MTRVATAHFPAAGSSVALWTAVLGAPFIWFMQMQSGYSLVLWVCKGHSTLVLHLITIIAAVLTLIGAFLSWRQFRQSGGGSPDETDGGAGARRRFLGALGAVSGLLYATLIIAQGIASFFFDPCWT